MNHYERESLERERDRLRRKFRDEDRATENLAAWREDDITNYGRNGVFKRTLKGWLVGGVVVVVLAVIGGVSGGNPINEACANGVIVMFTASLIGLCRGYIRGFG